MRGDGVVGDGSFDEAVLAAVAAHRTAWATDLARAVMALGTTWAGAALSALAAGAVVVLLRAYRPALAAAASAVLASMAADGLKQLFGRPRPPSTQAIVQALGPSFPSTQAALTSAVAAAVVVTVAWHTETRVRAAVALTALTVLVGACMVYLGAHWPTDVLAGWLLGGAVGSAMGWLMRARPNLRADRGRRA
jgi:membrane-associated phospholipid phosphatase